MCGIPYQNHGFLTKKIELLKSGIVINGMTTFNVTLNNLNIDSLEYLKKYYGEWNNNALGQLMNKKIFGTSGTNCVLSTVNLDGMSSEQAVDIKVVDTIEKVKPTQKILSSFDNYTLEYTTYGDSLFVIPLENCEDIVGFDWNTIDPSFDVCSENGGWWKPKGSLKQKSLHGWLFRSKSENYLHNFYPIKNAEHIQQLKPVTPKQSENTISELISTHGKIMKYGIGILVIFPEEIFKKHCTKNIITIKNPNNTEEYNGIKNVEKYGYFFENDAQSFINSIIPYSTCYEEVD